MAVIELLLQRLGLTALLVTHDLPVLEPVSDWGGAAARIRNGTPAVKA